MEDNKDEKGLVSYNSKKLKAIHHGSFSIKTFDEDLLALKSIVAGTSFQNLTEIEKKLIVNESKLDLLRETNNEHDEFAILVKYKDQKLGYVPKSMNQTTARLMDAGKQFYAKLVNKEWEGKWLRIDIEVFLKDG